MNMYGHTGGGIGYSNGSSYSVGLVENYEQPSDYEKHFLDLNAGLYVGLDHCWDPRIKYSSATQATALTFSVGASGGLGYDYYFDAIQLMGR